MKKPACNNCENCVFAVNPSQFNPMAEKKAVACLHPLAMRVSVPSLTLHIEEVYPIRITVVDEVPEAVFLEYVYEISAATESAAADAILFEWISPEGFADGDAAWPAHFFPDLIRCYLPMDLDGAAGVARRFPMPALTTDNAARRRQTLNQFYDYRNLQIYLNEQ